jgi:hypothetical protein
MLRRATLFQRRRLQGPECCEGVGRFPDLPERQLDVEILSMAGVCAFSPGPQALAKARPDRSAFVE